MTWLDRMLYGNSVLDWMLALGVALGSATLLLILRGVALRRLRRTAALPPTIAEVTSATRATALVVLALYVGAQFLSLPAHPTRVMEALAIVTLLVQVALWINRAIAVWLRRYVQANREADAAGATTVSVLGFIGRLAVWAAVALMILDNLGVNITTLVASLGIGGIAVALAVQNVLGDIFASLSIALDKPFVIGDFIVVGDVMGTIEYIGLKTTRLRSLSGEQIVFSNADLLKARIRNYKRMVERRVRFGFGVTYQTPAAQLERIPEMVRAIVAAQSRARFDRAHFREFGDSSLDFEVVYYVHDREYNTYMDIQQAINLALVRQLQTEGIEFAYPTRTLHVAGAVPAASTATGGVA